MSTKNKGRKYKVDPLLGVKVDSSGKPLAKGKNNPEQDKAKKVKRILELATVETPIELIATAVGETTASIEYTLREYREVFNQLGKLPLLRQKKLDLVEATMFKQLESLADGTKIADSSLRDSAYAFDVLHKATRLESNQSTSNHAHLSFTQDTKSIDDI